MRLQLGRVFVDGMIVNLPNPNTTGRWMLPAVAGASRFVA
jgi:hypothetical protein